MATNALLKWRTFRLKALGDFDHRQFESGPIDAILHEECLRSYTMLLSAHFQGFCRDLYSELAQSVAAAFPGNAAFILLRQFGSDLKLDTRNADYATIKSDFGRFGIDFDTALAPDEPTRSLNKARRRELHRLNQWRNYCAHYNDTHPTEAGGFGLAEVREWGNACDGFAGEMDRVAASHLASMGL
jgi:hypothetical protein